MRLTLRVSRELLEQILDFGERRIVGVEFKPLEDSPVEPTGWLKFTVEDPNAPDRVTEMSPTYQRQADGSVRMMDPGYL